MKPKALKQRESCAPIVVLPTATPKETLTELRSAGYVPVLCDDPTKVKVLLPEAKIHADDLLMSAMHGLASDHSHNERSRMVVELHRRLLKNEEEK